MSLYKTKESEKIIKEILTLKLIQPQSDPIKLKIQKLQQKLSNTND
tara:strand:- start:94 stop:231 length:138 start_codon:yes stop_codon:yes gene_type:complete